MRHSFGGHVYGWGAGYGAARTTTTGAEGRAVLTIAGATVTFWDQPAAGNQHFDLLDDTGSSVYFVTLAATAGAVPLAYLPRLQGPDGIPVMYAESGAGPRIQLVASDAHLYLQPQIDAIAGLQASTNSLGTEVTAVETTRTNQANQGASLDSRVTVLRNARRSAAAQLRPTAIVGLTSSVWTSIPFAAETFDGDSTDVNAGGHSTVTNNTRYTAPVAGYYLLSGTVAYEGDAVGSRYARWIVNGVSVSAGSVIAGANTSTTSSAVSVLAPTRVLALQAGDYVELQGYQSSGATLATVSTTASAPVFNISYLRGL